ncbi:unnamed protein product [Trichobilharzia regenti]|nr:unnamed protein product [Trichobilharzia regenti]
MNKSNNSSLIIGSHHKLIGKVTCSDIKCPREGMKCSPHHITGQPICMDCEDLPIDCNTEFRNGQVFIPSSSSRSSSSSSVGASEFGYPVWERSVKTYGWPTVCASNGKAYANTCFLHVVNCLSDTFIDLKKPGFCSGNCVICMWYDMKEYISSCRLMVIVYAIGYEVVEEILGSEE